MNPSTGNQRWKIQDLSESLNSSPLHTPFLFLTETHLKPYICEAEILIKNYTAFRADRSDRVRGGAAIYLHNSLVADLSRSFSNSYCEAAMVFNKHSNSVLVSIYRPPLAPFEKFSECMQVIEAFIAETPVHSPEVLIAGDFNFPAIDWDSCSIPTGASISQSDRHSALLLLNFADEQLLEQIVREPTRANKNILDLVFTNNSSMIHDISISNTIKSDHDIVRLSLLHPEFQLNPPGKPEYRPSCLLDDINFNSANWDDIRAELSTVDWGPVVHCSQSDQDLAWKQFEDTIANVCKKHAPLHSRNVSSSAKSNGLPRPRFLLLRCKRRLNGRINAIKYSKLRGVNMAKLSRLQDERSAIELQMRDELKGERAKKELNALSKIKKNPKAFYSFAKQNSSYKPPVGPLVDGTEELQSDPATMANILQEQYQKAFSDPENGKGDSFPDVPPKTDQILDDVRICAQDVLDAIAEMSQSSSPGPDKFPATILIECREILAEPIACMWQYSMDSGKIADLFKLQSITPVFKKGSRAKAVNYRPVSLTSHLVKLFERIVRKRMVTFIEDNRMFTASQHGFRSGRNCLTQLLHHIDDVLNDLSADANADVIYLDFAKAFDKVDHKILLKKLRSYGIGGRLYHWIESFLTGRNQFVVVEGCNSYIISVLSGVPQGTVLGPLLFLLYINDIEDVVNHSHVKIFADDSKLHKLIKSLTDRLLLQEDLENVVSWASANNMELNQDKFELLQHGKNPDLMLPYSLPSGQSITGSSCVRDLGVFIDPGLSWKGHISRKTEKSKNMASWVLRTFRARDVNTMLLLYKTYVRTHLEYCSPLWSPHFQGDIIRVEAVQRSFTAKITDCRSMNYWDRLKKLSLYSLQRRRERFAIILMWKIEKGLIPNSLDIQFRQTPRHGSSCIRPLGSSKYSSVNSLKFYSFASVGPALYNLLPPIIKGIDGLVSFKSALDAFLRKIPDTPPTPGYVPQNKNSVLEWVGNTQ